MAVSSKAGAGNLGWGRNTKVGEFCDYQQTTTSTHQCSRRPPTTIDERLWGPITAIDDDLPPESLNGYNQPLTNGYER